MGGWYPTMPCRWYTSLPWRFPGVVSQHVLQVSSTTPMGEHEGSGQGVSRPTPRWRMRGLVRGVSRPTPRGGFSRPTPRRVSPGPHPGGCLQAHTQEGVSRPTPRGVSPGPHPGGCLQAHTQGISRPHTKQSIPACAEADPPADGYYHRQYTS